MARKDVAILLIRLVGIVLSVESDEFIEVNEGSVGRIVDGHDAIPGEFPYMVYLRQGWQSCGGTLIDRHWVLSAGHCFRYIGSGVMAHVGVHHILRKPESSKYKVKEVFRHPKYNDKSAKSYYPNDLALFRLEKPVPESVATLTFAIDSNEDYVDTNCTILGWGKTSDGTKATSAAVLQKRSQTVLSAEVCRNHWSQHYNNDMNMCVSYPGGVCNGDSGGPLLCNKRLVGVASYASKLCEQTSPTVFTRVSKYHDWITETMSAYND